MGWELCTVTQWDYSEHDGGQTLSKVTTLLYIGLVSKLFDTTSYNKHTSYLLLLIQCNLLLPLLLLVFYFHFIV